jgi:hypothetical protein
MARQQERGAGYSGGHGGSAAASAPMYARSTESR